VQEKTVELTGVPAKRHVEAGQPQAAAATLTQTLQPVVIRFGRLGDMVILTALLHLLHHRFGRPCLVMAAGPWNAALYRGQPDVARLYSLARHFPMPLDPTSWRALWALRRSDPGPIYVCEYQPRQLRRIRRLLAVSGVDAARCVFISEDVRDEEEHWVERLLRFGQRTPPLLSAAEYPLPQTDCKPAPRLCVLDSERAELDAWLQAQGWAGRKLVLIQPGNFRTMSKRREKWRRPGADDKAWPLENWLALAHKVHAVMPEAAIVLCGAPQEGPMLEQIRRAAALPQLAVAELPLRRLLALCACAHSMISIDTGPAHAAAAVGLPLVVMYGAEPPRRWLPRSPSASPVIGVGGPPRATRVDQIAVEEVFSAWHSMLNNLRSGVPAAPQCALG
jgi:ADP-heptose:LPS heptosyltransferase